MSVSGSGRKLQLDGISFNMAADSNPARTPTVDKEDVVHTGGVNQKVTLMSGAIESQKLILEDGEYEVLQGLNERVGTFSMSYEKADGTVLRTGAGFIKLDNYEGEENSCEITMTPASRKWEVFTV